MIKSYTITVTAEHVRYGHAKDVCGCPIALAMIAAGFREPMVASRVVWAHDPEGWPVKADLPQEVRDAMRGFDERRRMEPFSFVLEPRRFARVKAAGNAGVAA